MVTYLIRLHLISWTCFSSLLSECFCQTYTSDNNTYNIYIYILIYIHSYIHSSPKPGYMPIVGNTLLGFIRTLTVTSYIQLIFFHESLSPSNSQSLRKLDLACNGIRQAKSGVSSDECSRTTHVLSLLRMNNKQLLYKEII